MEVAIIIMGIIFWALLAISTFCLCSICYIKLTYLKWDKEEKDFERFIKIHESMNSEYSEKNVK